MHFVRRFGAAAGVVLLVLAGSVIAYAAWAGTGGGNGQAQALSAATVNGNVTIHASTGAADMYPGNTTGGDVYFTVTNANPFNVTFSGGSVSYGAITICSNNNNTGTNPCTGLTTGNSCPWTVGSPAVPVAALLAGAPTTFNMSNINTPGTSTAPVNYVGTGASNNSSQQVLTNVLGLNSQAPPSCEGTVFLVNLTLGWTQGP